MANSQSSAKKGNEVLFAAVEMLFKVPPLFNMAVKQVCTPCQCIAVQVYGTSIHSTAH